MAKIFLSEYTSDKANISAQVYKWANGRGFEVVCYRHSEVVQSEVFDSESSAEDFADEWVLKNEQAGD